MSRTARWLEARWYQGAAVPWWLGLAERLFRGIAALRRRLYRQGILRSGHPGVPVIVVGNLVAGGSGKTPLTIALIEGLVATGRKPGVVSRGYGRASRGIVHVHAGSQATEVGDEPLEIHAATGVPVCVGEDRLRAARALVDAQAVDCLVADDGLQHYRLRRDFEIVAIDGRRGFGNGRMLPAGPLREPVSRAQEADLVLVRHGGEAAEDAAPGQLAWTMQVEGLRALESGTHEPLAAWQGRAVHAAAGTADPQGFFDTLRAAGLQIVEARAFPDHHRFTAADLAFERPLPLIVTGKDATKLRGLGLAGVHVLEVRARLPETVLRTMLARIDRRPGS